MRGIVHREKKIRNDQIGPLQARFFFFQPWNVIVSLANVYAARQYFNHRVKYANEDVTSSFVWQWKFLCKSLTVTRIRLATQIVSVYFNKLYYLLLADELRLLFEINYVAITICNWLSIV